MQCAITSTFVMLSYLDFKLAHNTTLVQHCAASMVRNDTGIELESIQALACRVDARHSQYDAMQRWMSVMYMYIVNRPLVSHAC